jgi:hypothetical protein
VSSAAKLVDPNVLAKKHRAAALLTLAPGQYQLQSTVDNRVLCTITVK